MYNYRIILLTLFVFSCNVLFADVKLPKIISDGMILQRDVQIPVWGWAPEGRKVTINFQSKKYTTISGKDGKWALKLDKFQAGGPYDMDIIGKDTIKLKNILIGDVWICSGQSNMGFKMSRIKDIYEEDIKKSDNPKIRQFEVPSAYNFKSEQQDVTGNASWKEANPTNVLGFSAVAYFFAKDLYEKYKVPVGLIHTSRGGTPAEAWMSEEALKDFPNHIKSLNMFKDDSYMAQIIENEKKAVVKWNEELDANDEGLKVGEEWYKRKAHDVNWKQISLTDYWKNPKSIDEFGSVWIKKDVDLKDVKNKKGALVLGNINEEDITYINGIKVGNIKDRYLGRNYVIPEGVLVDGINTITVRIIARNSTTNIVRGKQYFLRCGKNKIDLTGEWKYQIGATKKRILPQVKLEQKPAGLYNSMVAPIINYGIKGVIWYQGEANSNRASEYQKLFPALITNWRQIKGENFPFLYVQLASYLPVVNEPQESAWAELREAQLKTLQVPETGMASAIDLGEWNDIHPANKKDVGKRLALVAMKVAYKDNVVFSGPIYSSAQRSENKIIIDFTSVGSGLTSNNGQPLKHFSVAGQDGKFVWANAKIEGNKVIVWNDIVSTPIAVRYAWANNPEGANLYNKEGLPASPFRVDIP